MKIYLATWLYEPKQGDALTKVKYKHRLLSFFHTRERKEQFVDYILTGRNKKK